MCHKELPTSLRSAMSFQSFPRSPLGQILFTAIFQLKLWAALSKCPYKLWYLKMVSKIVLRNPIKVYPNVKGNKIQEIEVWRMDLLNTTFCQLHSDYWTRCRCVDWIQFAVMSMKIISTYRWVYIRNVYFTDSHVGDKNSVAVLSAMLCNFR